jgi:hypothetical protein
MVLMLYHLLLHKLKVEQQTLVEAVVVKHQELQ